MEKYKIGDIVPSKELNKNHYYKISGYFPYTIALGTSSGICTLHEKSTNIIFIKLLKQSNIDTINVKWCIDYSCPTVFTRVRKPKFNHKKL